MSEEQPISRNVDIAGKMVPLGKNEEYLNPIRRQLEAILERMTAGLSIKRLAFDLQALGQMPLRTSKELEALEEELASVMNATGISREHAMVVLRYRAAIGEHE